MRLVVDANIIVSAILGRRTLIGTALKRGLVLMAPEAQLAESATVLSRITGVDASEARDLVDQVVEEFVIVTMAEIAATEPAARQRLDARGQPDWPVLAASIVFDAGIWSNDRDFFGVGVPVWSIRNISYAIQPEASHA